MLKIQKSVVAIALGVAFSSSVFANESGVDFHGYARAGLSTTSNGGEQMCFGNGEDGHYAGRLGDECESYYELGLGHNFETKNGQSFYFDSMFSAETAQGAQYNDSQSLTESGAEASRADWSLRQLNVQAKGILSFAPEATVWAGKRFYQRHDVQALDLYYLNNSGYGAGIEHLDLGAGKFSAAVIFGDRSPYNGKTNAEGEQSVQTMKLDLRYSDIQVSDNAKLEVSAIYGRTDLTEIQDAASEAKEDGLFVTAELTSALWGLNNHLVLQYANDAMADAAWENASGSAIDTDETWAGDNDHSIRVINFGDTKLTNTVSLGYSVLYAQAETLAAEGDVSENKPYRFSLVLQPAYNWSDSSRTVLEVGYSKYKESDDTESQTLSKVMIAQEFTPDFGLPARATLSFYAGSFFGNVAEEYRYGSDKGEDGNFRFGAHISAAW